MKIVIPINVTVEYEDSGSNSRNSKIEKKVRALIKSTLISASCFTIDSARHTKEEIWITNVKFLDRKPKDA